MKETRMIKVYQIQLTDEEIAIVNSDGEYTPRIQAFFDRQFDSTFKPSNFEYYTHVATVDTDDMQEAFRLMNLWDNPEAVQKVTPRCASMSVGDILDVDGRLYRCASWGFASF